MQRLTAYLSSRLLSRRDDGYSTEAVIVTALLVAMAIGAVALISTAVMERAGSITGS
ncbi:hypothetical protein Q8791_12855 [Nocardiopsis sp. CT-R113]|uniref:Flp family type IVb pilin n=1 Tax=Nocardiopsis codii TaxID=3065942 RepID=A0ABU7K788_9ACTN|nr:hypothetical protein [Nocardiopsis sp. CT-R113]MEE2038106.1 hypothetical protein [Nocardiopsis sp. CT-R113]